MKATVRVLLFGLLVAILSACGSPSEPGELEGNSIAVDGGSYMDVTPDDLQTMLAAKDFIFINVHIPFEGNIPGTDLSIPFDQMAGNLALLPQDKDAKIVLYCRSDRMSRIAAETLIEAGYSNVWNLDGGFNAWKDAGLPFEENK
jgi:rhodanese-related sulfurtransferase